MKKNLLPLFAGLLTLVIACQKTDTTLQPATAVSKPDPTALDAFIKEKVLETGEFQWSWASNDMVWTALANSDQVMSVGFKPKSMTNLEVDAQLNTLNLQSPEWRAAKQAVLEMVLEQERKSTPGLTEEALIVWKEDVLPVLDVRILNPATVTALRNSEWVRYAEPMGYEPFMTRPADRSGSGCDSNNPEPGLAAGVDYTNIAPNSKQSWNHSFHNISQAWNNSTGSGCGIMIVDTGSSDDQDNLNEAFNQGSSSGRTITRLVTLPQNTNFWGQPTGSPETPHDECGHGTSMAGACAAPRGEDGAAAGIAYNADLTTVRAAADVYLDESREVKGVSDAFTLAGNSGNVRIVSMSMGRLTSSSQMTDAIRYASLQGKMIFCAAGTSFWWTSWFVGVIYPATLTEAIAVTGIKSNLSSVSRCSNCHSGSKVDFVLVMERNSDGRTPLSLDMNSDAPSTVGGSSVATASTAGIAALVWSKYPGWSRTQVFNRLKSSGNYYPNRNGSFGWGRVNAQTATN